MSVLRDCWGEKKSGLVLWQVTGQLQYARVKPVFTLIVKNDFLFVHTEKRQKCTGDLTKALSLPVLPLGHWVGY